MSVSLYDLSVASYLQILGGVANVLAKGEEYAAAGNMDLEQIVRYKLRDDSALQFSGTRLAPLLNVIAGLKAGEFSPPPKMSGMDYQALRGLVDEAIEGCRVRRRRRSMPWQTRRCSRWAKRRFPSPPPTSCCPFPCPISTFTRQPPCGAA